MIFDVIKANLNQIRHNEKIGRDEDQMNVLVGNFISNFRIIDIFDQPFEQRYLALNRNVQIFNSCRFNVFLLGFFVIKIEELHFT